MHEHEVAIGGPGVRGLLALLAMRANSVVTVDDIIDALWGDDPPATARTIVQGNVSHLRRVLRAVPQDEVAIHTAAPGYELVIPPRWVDAVEARLLLEQAASAALDRRAALLAQAFALWRGPELAGVPATVTAPELEELRLAVHGARVDADLELGRHAALIAELAPIVRENPLSERTVGQLMTALCRAGRRADALEIYRRVSRHSADVLGIGPGPELQSLHERVLRDDPSVTGSPEAPDLVRLRPAQLPPSVPNLAGRQADLAWLSDLREVAERGANAVGVVTGPAGVGKSTLVVSWAHGAASGFGDGVLFAWLRGFDPGQPALAAGEVLAQFLLGLRVHASEMPEGFDDRLALYRSLLADRRVLVLLDDAVSAEQVRPLLPPGNGSMALVTSRYRLEGLAVSNAARLLPLDTLPPGDAVRLVEELAGTGEAGRNERVARLCGYLPLALRIAAARLAASPQWMVDDVVDELADERTRLAALDVGGGDVSVRAALDVSFRGLRPEQADTFARLGVLTGTSVRPHLVAAISGTTVPVARERLRELATQHLLTESTRNTFEPHDLVRLYLRELAGRLPEAERTEIMHRAVNYFLAASDTARRVIGPVSDDLDFRDLVDAEVLPVLEEQDRALAWFSSEWQNLRALLDNAFDTGMDIPVWQLVRLAHSYRRVRPSWDEWLAVTETGLFAAERGGDRLALFWMLISRCGVRIAFGVTDGAVADARRAYDLVSEADGELVLRTRENQLGCALAREGRVEEASTHLRVALELADRLGDDGLRSQVLGNCAWTENKAGRYAEAIEYQRAALEIDRGRGDRGNVVSALGSLADICFNSGDLDAAEEWAREAIALCDGRDITMEEADVRLCLGRILRAKGDHEAARTELTASLRLHEKVRSARRGEILAELTALDGADA
ncbi:SARP family transcriptional regulator [Amycolatopsis antarctica]|uniref:SARP family transcriptional regulator n=2 Tax=Amycolatopsis antarctica TaxID=1854586 RepID=A0A263CY04_9PSEU|nr:SARP family transcriptional regulator [Amycolatopsis antarctica]